MNLSTLVSQFSLALGGALVLSLLLWIRLRRILADPQKRPGYIAGDVPIWMYVLGALGIGLLTVLIVGGILQGLNWFQPFTFTGARLSQRYSIREFSPTWSTVQSLIAMFLRSAALEELVKVFLIWLITRGLTTRAYSVLAPSQRSTFITVVPVFLGFIFGIGFGAGETLLFALGNFQLLVLRGSTAVILHGVTAGIAARSIPARELGLRSWAWIAAAMGIHWLYNLLLALPSPFNYLVFVLLAGAMVRILGGIRATQ
ncbi:PrsW family intramembrane metalloprotease [Spirochaeta lutea]|uniref:Uncharacterized protein n=1 Tax=Spirochaeta lutea TaxID=1480694 RepID=A0A098R2F8_9SPIO|nr:PrsW family intramembrane metalloprotease [Spirochaeta lutea]KGE73818.1 hypothetical protein DC28_00955 [Spirochaeta lutea]